jgi:two-component system, OmpR family, phosphate regulon response regulator PhoB
MPAKVLVCDNEEVLRRLVRAALDGGAYEIAEARDGDESVELARRLEPDLIVLNIMMPGRSGVDVLGELRRDPRFRETPVVMLTARAQIADREAASRAGADYFLAKPFSPKQLASVVEGILDGPPTPP